MMKNISIVISLAAFVLLGACTPTNQTLENRDAMIFRKIESLCDAKGGTNSDKSPCIVKLADVFDFPWEKMYVFDMAVEDHVISEAVGSKNLTTSNQYSVKWYFVKAGEVVQVRERVIIEIDRPIQKGDVELEINDAQNKFAIFEPNTSVEVSKMKLGDGNFIYLKRR